MSDWWTPLRVEIHESEVKIGRELIAALTRCRSSYEITQCIEAYAFVARTYRDVIGQRHGLPPSMLFPIIDERHEPVRSELKPFQPRGRDS